MVKVQSGFSNLKKNSKNNLAKLNEQVSKLNSSGFQADPTYWTLTRDKAGNGIAIIRFLPPMEGEDFPFVRFWEHYFKGPGGIYAEKSLTTISQADPVYEYNGRLYNSGIEANQKIAQAQKRHLRFVSNIYVIKDTNNPDAEGKVFRFKYGKKIFDKINAKMNPVIEDGDEDVDPINPFDFWEGANFKLKAKTVKNFVNYDDSAFSNPSALLDGDDQKLEEVYKQLHSLQSEIAPDKFKNYDELSAHFYKVIGQSKNAPIPTPSNEGSPLPDSNQTGMSSTPKTSRPLVDMSDDGDEDSDRIKKELQRLVDEGED